MPAPPAIEKRNVAWQAKLRNRILDFAKAEVGKKQLPARHEEELRETLRQYGMDFSRFVELVKAMPKVEANLEELKTLPAAQRKLKKISDEHHAAEADIREQITLAEQDICNLKKQLAEAEHEFRIRRDRAREQERRLGQKQKEVTGLLAPDGEIPAINPYFAGAGLLPKSEGPFAKFR